MLYFIMWNSPCAAICFDDVYTTTRAKEAEWAARSLTTGMCDPVMLEALLAEHKLPADFNDFIADRFLRQRLNTYLRDELIKRLRLSMGLATMQRLAVFNAGVQRGLNREPGERRKQGAAGRRRRQKNRIP